MLHVIPLYMLLIAGLGNPGEKYARNRHNAGFMFVDYMVQWLNGSMANNRTTEQSNNSFKFDKYTNADVAKATWDVERETHNVLFIKPQTYMNRSGESIKKLITNYELQIVTHHSPPTTSSAVPRSTLHAPRSTFHVPRLFVAHDDLDIELGKFKIQLGVGPKKHNGLSSIENHLHSNDFWRIRIGVDNRNGDRTQSGEEYVLQNFSTDEDKKLQETFPEIFSYLLTIFKK